MKLYITGWFLKRKWGKIVGEYMDLKYNYGLINMVLLVLVLTLVTIFLNLL